MREGSLQMTEVRLVYAEEAVAILAGGGATGSSMLSLVLRNF